MNDGIEVILHDEKKFQTPININDMIKLYLKMPDEYFKSQFLAELRYKICEGEFKGLEYFLLEFLIKIDRIDQILIYWDKFNDKSSITKLWLLICYESKYFSPQDLEEIKKRAKHDIAKKSIYDQIMAIKRKSLHQELTEKANPEINFDVERVREEMDHFGFPKELSILLSEIESSYREAMAEKDFNDVADKVRKLLDQLITQVSDRVAHLKNIEIAKGKRPKPSRRRQFLREQKLIAKNEQKLLDAIYDIVSEEGTHSLKSSTERTRICRNIAVEICLYLLRRLREFEGEVSAANS